MSAIDKSPLVVGFASIAAHHPFRSREAKRLHLQSYDKQAEQWPVLSENRLVDTLFGQTFVSFPDLNCRKHHCSTCKSAALIALNTHCETGVRGPDEYFATQITDL